MIAAGRTVDPTSAAKMAELLALFDRMAEESAARRRGDTVPSVDTHDAPPSFEPHIRFSRDSFVMSLRPHSMGPLRGEEVIEETNPNPYLGLNFGILPESK